MRKVISWSFAILAAATTLAGWPVAAGESRTAVTPLPLYRQECASCHTAYPPGLLPPASWERLMKSLPQHFGSDASVDAATARDLSRWLQANAGRGEPPPQDRITKSAWFVREHREVPAAAWQRPSIRNASNCAACHTRADQGDFNEHTVRIPR